VNKADGGIVFTNGERTMAGSTLRNSIIVLGLVTAALGGAYVLSDDSAASANAAQPGGRTVVLMSGPCWHVGVSDWTCPDSMMAVQSADYVTSVSVTVETKDGKRTTTKLPAGIDAIFLTRDATEKFLVSYYWATNKGKAEALTRKLATIKDAAAR
jgi:hypothetical protein